MYIYYDCSNAVYPPSSSPGPAGAGGPQWLQSIATAVHGDRRNRYLVRMNVPVRLPLILSLYVIDFVINVMSNVRQSGSYLGRIFDIT